MENFFWEKTNAVAVVFVRTARCPKLIVSIRPARILVIYAGDESNLGPSASGAEGF
jgi:hypothetical protein